MARKRSTFSAEFKMQVAIEALQETMTLQALAEKHGVSVKNIMNWKQRFFQNALLAFGESERKESVKSLKKENAALEKKLRQLTVEHDFIMRKLEELKRQEVYVL